VNQKRKFFFFNKYSKKVKGFWKNNKKKKAKTVALVFCFFIVLKLQKLFFGEYLFFLLFKFSFF